MLIYVETPLKQKERTTLSARVGNAHEVYFNDESKNSADSLNVLKKAGIIFGNPKPDIMSQAENAKWIQLFTAGFEYYQNVTTSAVVTNMDDYYSQPCAETIIAGLMGLYRKIDVFSLLKEEKKWIGAPLRYEIQLLQNKKVIILGTGNIGRRIAKILGAFDAEILFFGRSAPDAVMHNSEELKEKIPWADCIIGCLPGSAQTKGLFTKEMIMQMNQGAVFCNVGRGNLVDQDALIEALMNKKIGGAVLDVTYDEPIAADSKLWDCPNTILTQHSGGGQLTEYEGLVEIFLENFDNYVNGRPLKNIINFQKGY